MDPVDRSFVTSSISRAMTIVATYGLSGYLSNLSRRRMAEALEDSDNGFTVEFVKDPSADNWGYDNIICTLSFRYSPKDSDQRWMDGSIVRNYVRSVRIGSRSEHSVKEFAEHEVTRSNVILLGQMLELATEEQLLVIISTPEQTAKTEQLSHERIIGERILTYLKRGHKGLHRGGKERDDIIELAYVQRYLAMPPVGAYRVSTNRFGRFRVTPSNYVIHVLDGKGSVVIKRLLDGDGVFNNEE